MLSEGRKQYGSKTALVTAEFFARTTLKPFTGGARTFGVRYISTGPKVSRLVAFISATRPEYGSTARF
jgi:hypothetical protein